MKQTKYILPIAIVASILTASAEAEIIQINAASGSVQLHSQSMELLSSTSPYLSTTDLSIAHSTLSDWGISTDGKITILPVNTSQGLSLFTIIDDELGGGDTGSDASLGLITTASSTLEMFINDADQDSWELIGSPFGSQTLGATFSWDSSGSGDGFAWADLAYGDTVSYSFTDLDGDGGAIDAEAFQFLSWDAIEGWGIVSTNGFKVDGTSVFTGLVIPAPPAALMLTALAMGLRRRRH
jgi:hypothetical protein